MTPIADALLNQSEADTWRAILDAQVAVDARGERPGIESRAALIAWMPLPDYADRRWAA